ncbi:hypothetical protein E3N88_05272 [Mikania micrantha]|uniref:Ubiquitin-like protease family profile domain-containing protein n=1 Tax=Mikania micrantha TaxID=192012 RepID=A0A5N6PL56_9ASTR|nr:hypothetical protein E3N88_05272 [Mikania micrantha]
MRSMVIDKKRQRWRLIRGVKSEMSGENIQAVDDDDDFESPPPPPPPKSTTKTGTSKSKFVEFDNTKRLRTRNPPKSLCEFLDILTDEQKSAVDDIGFSSIKDFKIKAIPSCLAYWLLYNYDPASNMMNLGSERIKITPGLVCQTLGIPMGKIQLEEKKTPSLSDPVVAEFRQQFQGINGIPTVKTITDLVKSSGDSGRMFKINFLVVFNTIMAQMSQGSTANMSFLTSFNQGADFKSFDWCSYIITCLNRTKDKWNGKQHYNGPATFLTLLYAHHMNERSHPSKKRIPAISYTTFDILMKLEKTIGCKDNKMETQVSNQPEPNRKTTKRKIREEIEEKMNLEKSKKVKKKSEVQKEESKKIKTGKASSKHEVSQKQTDILPSDDNWEKQSFFKETNESVEGLSAFASLQLISESEQPTNEWVKLIRRKTFELDEFVRDVEVQIKECVKTCKGSDEILEPINEWKSRLSKYNKQDQNQSSNEAEGDSLKGVKKEEDNRVDLDSQISETMVQEMVKVVEKVEQGHADKEKVDAMNEDILCSQKGEDDALDLNQDEANVEDENEDEDVVFLRKEKSKNLMVYEKRKTKLAEALRSPYRQRIIQIGRKRELIEELVADWIFSANGGICEEQYRSNMSPTRLFCPCNMMGENNFKRWMKNAEMLEHFETNVNVALVGSQFNSINQINLLIIPVLQTNHYYLVCFNLKNPAIEIVDNIRGRLHARCAGNVRKVQKIVSLYLEKESPALHKKIVNLKPKKLEMPWQTEKNFIDCGIFAMRHMETYMGKEIKEWKEDCAILEESSGKQNEQLLDLRYKYLSKILLSDINILHDEVTKEVKKFEELDEEVKRKMRTTARKRIQKRKTQD